MQQPLQYTAVAHKYATHNRFTALWTLQDNPGVPVPEETFTHSHVPWSSVIPYLLPPSVTICSILPVQYMCLTVFFCPSVCDVGGS